MSKYKVGDKVRTIKDRDCKIGIITDIDEDANFPYQVRVGDNDNYYYSEDMLEPHIEKTYEDGLADVWELVKKFYDFSRDEVKEILGVDGSFYELVKTFTPQEVLAKIEAYEKSQNEIKVGDVVYIDQVANDKLEDDSEAYGVVTGIYDGSDHYEVLMRNGDGASFGKRQMKKTGRHIDIEHLLEQLRGNE